MTGTTAQVLVTALPLAPRVGLSTDEARARLDRFGPNELPRTQERSAWKVWARQFKGAMVWVLLAAALLSLFVGQGVDAIAIGAILILNAVVGFLQEFRAERSLQALRSLSAPRARVMRDGQVREVAARDVVPGDLLALEAGDLVAADARLIEAHALRTVEAALTGESAPVDKGRDGDAAGRTARRTAWPRVPGHGRGSRARPGGSAATGAAPRWAASRACWHGRRVRDAAASAAARRRRHAAPRLPGRGRARLPDRPPARPAASWRSCSRPPRWRWPPYPRGCPPSSPSRSPSASSAWRRATCWCGAWRRWRRWAA